MDQLGFVVQVILFLVVDEVDTFLSADCDLEGLEIARGVVSIFFVEGDLRF